MPWEPVPGESASAYRGPQQKLSPHDGQVAVSGPDVPGNSTALPQSGQCVVPACPAAPGVVGWYGLSISCCGRCRGRVTRGKSSRALTLGKSAIRRTGPIIFRSVIRRSAYPKTGSSAIADTGSIRRTGQTTDRMPSIAPGNDDWRGWRGREEGSRVHSPRLRRGVARVPLLGPCSHALRGNALRGHSARPKRNLS